MRDPTVDTRQKGRILFFEPRKDLPKGGKRPCGVGEPRVDRFVLGFRARKERHERLPFGRTRLAQRPGGFGFCAPKKHRSRKGGRGVFSEHALGRFVRNNEEHARVFAQKPHRRLETRFRREKPARNGGFRPRVPGGNRQERLDPVVYARRKVRGRNALARTDAAHLFDRPRDVGTARGKDPGGVARTRRALDRVFGQVGGLQSGRGREAPEGREAATQHRGNGRGRQRPFVGNEEPQGEKSCAGTHGVGVEGGKREIRAREGA